MFWSSTILRTHKHFLSVSDSSDDVSISRGIISIQRSGWCILASASHQIHTVQRLTMSPTDLGGLSQSPVAPHLIWMWSSVLATAQSRSIRSHVMCLFWSKKYLVVHEASGARFTCYSPRVMRVQSARRSMWWVVGPLYHWRLSHFSLSHGILWKSQEHDHHVLGFVWVKDPRLFSHLRFQSGYHFMKWV